MTALLENFHFLRPWLLLAFIPFAMGLWWLLRRHGRAGVWESLCDRELLPYVTEQRAQHRGLRHLLTIFIGTCIIVALAGPTWQQLPTPVFRQDSALVIVLDLSRSMNAADIKPTRLERAKFKISDLLRLRKDGQTALLVFAEQPYIVTPLTSDAKTIENQLPALTSDVMPSQGSNLVAAIEKAAELLQQAGVRGGDVLVLSDAVKTDPSRLTELVSEQKMRISVIGVGTPQGAPVMNDNGSFIADESGNVILMTLNTVGLREIATLGNGLYQTISNDDTDVERVARFVDAEAPENTEDAADLFAERWREFGPWLLLACLPFAPLAFRRGLLVALLACNLVSFSPYSGAKENTNGQTAYWFRTPDQKGQKAFDQQAYGEAKKHFDNDAWRAASAYREGDYAAAVNALGEPQGPDDWYNKGNALARMGEYEDAISAYEQALSLTEEHEDAAHNKTLLEKLLDEQQQQQNEGDGEQSENEGEEDSGGESQGESEDGSPSEQQGGDSTAESEQMNEENQSDAEANQNADNEEKQQQQEQQSQQADAGEQDGGKPNDVVAEAEPQTEAEQAQATEQWLRQIPDDPGGLLRRKFEYEHKRRGFKRERGTQQW